MLIKPKHSQSQCLKVTKISQLCYHFTKSHSPYTSKKFSVSSNFFATTQLEVVLKQASVQPELATPLLDDCSPNFPACLLMLMIVSLSLLTAQESQTSPNLNPVFKSLDVQKGTLPHASLQTTESMTARSVPTMPTKNCVRRCGSSGRISLARESLFSGAVCFQPSRIEDSHTVTRL
ncbi:hypothetical protein AAHE18_12G195300 [Arachis hypogaea]